MSVLDKVRKWIDGETAEGVLEEAARNAQVKPRSKAEEFIVQIARSVEEIMQRELVPLPQGTVIIPSEYTIFLSQSDDKEWQGAKRKGLEQGLYHILSERARELVGKKKLETEALVVQFKIDGTLEAGEIRVEHSWEDNSHPKTQVLPRGNAGQSVPQAVSSDVFGQPNPGNPPYPFQAPNPSVPVDDMTHVARRPAQMYRLEIWRNGTQVSVLPVSNNEIVIGRGSVSKPVDVALPGDPEISRRHLILQTDGMGVFWVINQGRNPAVMNGMDLVTGVRVPVPPGVPIMVCSYVLRIQS